jgi:hypothetical protein
VWYHASLSYMDDDDNKNKETTTKRENPQTVCMYLINPVSVRVSGRNKYTPNAMKSNAKRKTQNDKQSIRLAREDQ